MDLLIESWEWSLGLAIAFGVMMFIGFKLGTLIGYTAVEGIKTENRHPTTNFNNTSIGDLSNSSSTPKSDL